jgi:capsular polysaccharide biosynthesis protein
MMDHPSDAEALREPIATLVNEGRLVDARALCVTSRAAFPLDPWLATMQAYVALLLADSQQAVQIATEALALGSEDPLASLVLGVAHRNRGRHAEAAEALLTASRLWPDRLDAATMVIEETAAAHGLQRAAEVYREVFGRLPDHSLSILLARIQFDAGLDADMPDGIVSAPFMSVPAWLARTDSTPEFLGVQETIQLEEPPVFGEPNPGRFKGSVPGYTSYSCTLRGATIFAKSSIVLTQDGAALNDTIADERFGQFLVLDHDKTVLRWDDERLLLDVGAYQLEEIPAGVMLSGWASEHFGHWIPEYIFRLAYLERHPRFAELPIIVDSDMPPQHLEYLRILVSNPIVQIPAGGALRCGELIVGSPSTFFPINLVADHQVPPENQGGLPTDGLRFVQARMLERLPPPEGPRDRKLYLSRKGREWRRPLNEDEISAMLAAEGFEILFPEELSFEEQVRMYQSAAVVVAPNGSSLLNAMFAPKDLRLIVLSQRGLFNWATFYGPMRELGYEMTFLCSDEETDWKHGNYEIPLPRLREALGLATKAT